MESAISKVAAAVACLVCAVAALKSSDGFDGAEVQGGSIANHLLDGSAIGAILFLVVALILFRHARTAAVGAFVASALCLPLYVYCTLPRLFYRILGADHIFVPLKAFEWNGWAVTGVLSTAFVVCLCSRSFLSRPGRQHAGVNDPGLGNGSRPVA